MNTKIIMFSVGMLMALVASFLGLIIAWVSYRRHRKSSSTKQKEA